MPTQYGDKVTLPPGHTDADVAFLTSLLAKQMETALVDLRAHGQVKPEHRMELGWVCLVADGTTGPPQPPPRG